MAQMIHAKDLRPNHTFVYKNEVYLVLENSFNKTAMREGIVKCKVKNLRTNVITVEVLTGEKFKRAIIDKIKAVFSYNDHNNFVFMETESFDEINVPITILKWKKNFLVQGQTVSIMKYDSEILNVSLPDQVSLIVKYAEDAVAGNSVQSASKRVILETDYEIEAPLFIKTGDRINVNTITGCYVSKANKK